MGVTVIRQSYVIHSAASKVWDALTNSATITKWGAGPVKMDAKVGTKFKLWGGDIWGKNLKIAPKKQLVQEWYDKRWKKPSQVTISLSEEHGITYLDMLQENVPDGDRDKINKGWKDFYFGPLKNFLEGAQLDSR
ncbi:MAG: Activator of Hsp90 ATPase 1 family protein [Candidatus Gottesmanbacteria bacterium GW2011_GWA1_48_13]|uniref:Activator of Hsp90 ATPase 1 family protein n=1 Tax=Candidatus Gottesmanbacteria bacterium GW2011_GWA1_48_13 TaxID=1618439 RepID=A0A0G1UPM1_9BACT|nr:MAG: Activator of Hsp90 ATPase 1 family protein [Candidatus Gottesmanbacteria bacterium GW2011_GWA1_48_13]